MKGSLLNKIKLFVNKFKNNIKGPYDSCCDNKRFEKIRSNVPTRKLLFKKITKSNYSSVGGNPVTVYTIPVEGCSNPAAFEKEIKRALQKYFYSRNMNNWSFYSIENGQVNVCKFSDRP